MLTCAENAIEILCDYAGRSSNLCAKILPSDIQKHLKPRFPQRIVPSHGLCTEDISYLLRKLGFSPVIYRRGFDTDTVASLANRTKTGTMRQRIEELNGNGISRRLPAYAIRFSAWSISRKRNWNRNQTIRSGMRRIAKCGSTIMWSPGF